MAKKQDSGAHGKGTPLLEYAAGAVGAIIAVVMVVILAREALTTRQSVPPLLIVQAQQLHIAPNYYAVEVKVLNRSEQTAAAVHLEGQLKLPDGKTETSSATISYVPGHSEQHGGLIFSNDPRGGKLQLRATGYEQP